MLLHTYCALISLGSITGHSLPSCALIPSILNTIVKMEEQCSRTRHSSSSRQFHALIAEGGLHSHLWLHSELRQVLWGCQHNRSQLSPTKDAFQRFPPVLSILFLQYFIVITCTIYLHSLKGRGRNDSRASVTVP